MILTQDRKWIASVSSMQGKKNSNGRVTSLIMMICLLE